MGTAHALHLRLELLRRVSDGDQQIVQRSIYGAHWCLLRDQSHELCIVALVMVARCWWMQVGCVGCGCQGLKMVKMKDADQISSYETHTLSYTTSFSGIESMPGRFAWGPVPVLFCCGSEKGFSSVRRAQRILRA